MDALDNKLAQQRAAEEARRKAEEAKHSGSSLMRWSLPLSREDPQDQECFHQDDDGYFLLASGEQGGHRKYIDGLRDAGGAAD